MSKNAKYFFINQGTEMGPARLRQQAGVEWWKKIKHNCLISFCQHSLEGSNRLWLQYRFFSWIEKMEGGKILNYQFK